MTLLEAAECYAESKGATIIGSRVDGNSIIFVLNTGPKLTMTREELDTENAEIKQASTTENPEVALATIKKIKKGK